jgi:Na+-translocating ferredoxin:NAD+ oxidoreductase RnfG subunit
VDNIDKVKNLMKKESFKIIAVLAVTALICALLLTTVYLFTKVDETARFKEQIAKYYASPLTDETVNFSRYRDKENTAILNVYKAQNGAYVIHSKSLKAYAAEGIELIVIIKEGNIEKVVRYKSAETPGLGSRALEESYLSKYEKLTVKDFSMSDGTPTLESPNKGSGAPKGVDGITGATKSSDGVRLAVEAAVRIYVYLEGANG